jgi:transcriptional regulator GlxA family with amidase domain
MRIIGALVFPEFETLDLFGPIQMFGSVKGAFQLSIVSEHSHPVPSRHGQSIAVDRTFDADPGFDLLLIPGGPGTWDHIHNPRLLNWIVAASQRAEIIMSVCTGAAFLAMAGLLDGRCATTNKMDFDWVTQFGNTIAWQGHSRWVGDGRFYTSSGVSAGMDMSLAVIEVLLGAEAADQAAIHSEYVRQRDPDNDPFARHLDTAPPVNG